jgi:hypothetical protein
VFNFLATELHLSGIYSEVGELEGHFSGCRVPISGCACDFGNCGVKSIDMRYLGFVVTVACVLPAFGQHVADPHASVLSVATRQATLKSTTDPIELAAIRGLHSCVDTPMVEAPAGPMNIPHHYLSGSNGPTNPAEAAATRVYAEFEGRITAGMNQYLATGSHAESACALAQLDAWAGARALLNYDRKDSPQAWYQVEWTLSSAARDCLAGHCGAQGYFL